MFELQLGEKLSIKEQDLRKLTSPLLLVGKSGQGKSVFLVKFALELIRNNQTGILYDPYGDLCKKLAEHLKTKESQNRVKLLSQDEDINFEEAQDKFLLIHGDLFREGNRATQKKAQRIIQAALSSLNENNWLLVDEAFSCLTDDIFNAYTKKGGPKKLLSCQDFLHLSEEERKTLFSITQGIFIYKPRGIDAKSLAENFEVLDKKSIGAIKQYHFQYLYPYGKNLSPNQNQKKPGYDTVPWPLS